MRLGQCAQQSSDVVEVDDVVGDGASADRGLRHAGVSGAVGARGDDGAAEAVDRGGAGRGVGAAAGEHHGDRPRAGRGGRGVQEGGTTATMTSMTTMP